MGQKINPLGFRLGVTQKHHSYWFAQPKKLF
jgi:small subunit ribosomal protein S3